MRLFTIVLFSIFIVGCSPFSTDAKATDKLMKDMKTAMEAVEKCNSVGFTPYIRIRETAPEIVFDVRCYETK